MSYSSFHAWGLRFLPAQAHAGMAFFFTTISGSYWMFVVPAMLAVIAGKEWLDYKETPVHGYSWFDLVSWVVGSVLAIGWYLL